MMAAPGDRQHMEEKTPSFARSKHGMLGDNKRLLTWSIGLVKTDTKANDFGEFSLFLLDMLLDSKDIFLSVKPWWNLVRILTTLCILANVYI